MCAHGGQKTREGTASAVCNRHDRWHRGQLLETMSSFDAEKRPGEKCGLAAYRTGPGRGGARGEHVPPLCAGRRRSAHRSRPRAPGSRRRPFHHDGDRRHPGGEADVPFRSAHSYASELARYGRATGKRPADLADEELSRLYQETIGGPLPIGVGAIRDAMSAEKTVANRKGLGGPQAESVRGMLDRHRDSLAQTRRWLAGKRAALAVASKDLQTAFEGLSQPDR